MIIDGEDDGENGGREGGGKRGKDGGGRKLEISGRGEFVNKWV